MSIFTTDISIPAFILIVTISQGTTFFIIFSIIRFFYNLYKEAEEKKNEE